MPQNITDVSTYTTPIVAPADGDAETAGSVLTGLQGLANRTALHQAVLTSTGVTLIRGGDSTAMQTLTGVADKTLFLLNAGSGSVRGVYQYIAADVKPPDNSMVYAATGMGVGNWVHVDYGKINQNLGLAGIGPISGFPSVSANKLQLSVQTNPVVQLLKVSGAIAFSTSSGSFVDVTSLSTTISVTAGDIVDITMGPLQLYTSSSNTASAIRMRIIDGGGNNDFGVYQFGHITDPYAANWMTLCNLYTVTNTGTLTIKAQIQSDGAASTTCNTPVSGACPYIILRQYRP